MYKGNLVMYLCSHIDLTFVLPCGDTYLKMPLEVDEELFNYKIIIWITLIND